MPQDVNGFIVHETDVLVLGAAAAGTGAALAALESGQRVLLVDKGKFESCGSIGGGNDHFMAVLNTDAPFDTTEDFISFYDRLSGKRRRRIPSQSRRVLHEKSGIRTAWQLVDTHKGR